MMMPEFLKILLFANMVVLTPEPVNIDKGYLEINLKDPIFAITEGAALHVDVSLMAPDEVDGITAARAWLRERFKEEFSTAVLVNSSNGKEVALRYYGESAWSEGEIHLLLSSKEDIPSNLAFDKVIFETDIDLHNVRIIWKNYQK